MNNFTKIVQKHQGRNLAKFLRTFILAEGISYDEVTEDEFLESIGSVEAYATTAINDIWYGLGKECMERDLIDELIDTVDWDYISKRAIEEACRLNEQKTLIGFEKALEIIERGQADE